MANALGLSENATQQLQANLADERPQLDRLQNITHGFDLQQLQQQTQ